MGRSKPVDLKIVSFPSQKEATEFYRAMLARYSAGDSVSEADSVLLLALLMRHPQAAQKVGSGVREFSVQKNALHPQNEFWLRRLDASETEFSYLKCIRGTPTPPRTLYLWACREAVRVPVREAKRRFFDEHADTDGRVVCEETGRAVTLDECHLDHKPPKTFEVLADNFAAAYGFEPAEDMFEFGADGQTTVLFRDSRISEAFVHYHHKAADLRIVSAKRNLALGPKQRVRKPKRPVSLPRPAVKGSPLGPLFGPADE